MRWMMYIVAKFGKAENLVIDECAGTFSVGEACMVMMQDW